MKRELNNFELDEVTGGNVTLSAPTGLVKFSAIHRMCKIKGDFVEMRTLLLDLYDEHADMTDVDFDNLVFSEFLSRGWI